MHDLLLNTAERALQYLEHLDERKVAPDPAIVAHLAALDTPLPDDPTAAENIIELLDTYNGATMAMAGQRFFGLVTGGALPATVAANWLATTWDQNTTLYKLTPLAAQLENVALHWLCDLFGFPPETGVGFVTGGTVANFTCLLAARHKVLQQVGWDVDADGLFGAPAVNVIVSEEAHITLLKSLVMAGFGRKHLIRVPVDNQGRIQASAFPDNLIGPTIVCLQAGNVNTGAFDPLSEIIPKAHAANAWVHIDGAFGLWAACTSEKAHVLTGFTDADSWATDAHKYLNTPYDCGLAFVRDAQALQTVMKASAAYLSANDTMRNPGHFTPEFSRRARGIEVWAALLALGRSGVADLVERTCHYATRFAEGLRDAGYTILNEVVLNQVLVVFDNAEKTTRVIEAIQQDGTCWCGGTVWQGKTAMRISVSSWATTEDDVERSLEAIIRIADTLA